MVMQTTLSISLKSSLFHIHILSEAWPHTNVKYIYIYVFIFIYIHVFIFMLIFIFIFTSIYLC